MIEVKVIADSINSGGERITTMQLKYPRFIHSEFMTHRSFCLDGDSILKFDLPSGTSTSKYRVHEMTIKEFVTKWHTGVKPHKAPRFVDHVLSAINDTELYTAKELSKLVGQKTPSNLRSACRMGKVVVENPCKPRSEDFVISGANYKSFRGSMGTRTFSIRERLSSMKIRQLNEITGVIQHSSVLDCCASGIKPVFKVTAGDFSVSGSKDHLVLSTSGWKPISELIVGQDSIIVEKFGLLNEHKSDPRTHKKIGGEWRSKWQANMLDVLTAKQQGNCAVCGCATKLEVHHVIPVQEDHSLAFSDNNVVALCKKCHNSQHTVQGWQVSQYLHGSGVLVDSITLIGDRETFDLEIAGEFPNFIANGVVVHNSRNASSSRAIPVRKMLRAVWCEPATPVHWGSNKPGMQAGAELRPFRRLAAKVLWKASGRAMCGVVWAMSKMGLHKQVSNRLLEPWQHIHVVVTSTEWQNFFDLRCHPDAQPEFQELAKQMRLMRNISSPVKLDDYDWHLPYIDCLERQRLSTMEAIQVSAARCCRVSYLNHEGRTSTLEQDVARYESLVNAVPPHMSPVEHQAMALPGLAYANFKGWASHRWLLEESVGYRMDRGPQTS